MGLAPVLERLPERRLSSSSSWSLATRASRAPLNAL